MESLFSRSFNIEKIYEIDIVLNAFKFIWIGLKLKKDVGTTLRYSIEYTVDVWLWLVIIEKFNSFNINVLGMVNLLITLVLN